jgi:hypothetical protein
MLLRFAPTEVSAAPNGYRVVFALKVSLSAFGQIILLPEQHHSGYVADVGADS